MALSEANGLKAALTSSSTTKMLSKAHHSLPSSVLQILKFICNGDFTYSLSGDIIRYEDV